MSYALCITGAFEKPGGGPASGDDGYTVAAARSGSRAALESLLRRHYDRCYALCRRLLGDEEDALDATQEAMVAVARGIGNFDGRSAFATWVYRVTTNVAFDELRRRKRRPLGEAWREPGGAMGVRRRAASGAWGWDELGESVSARVTLDEALSRLSEEHRAAVVLRDLLDLEYAEIAEVLLVPIGTVRSRIARGRAALARALAGEDEAFVVTGPGSGQAEPPPSEAGGEGGSGEGNFPAAASVEALRRRR